jgi:hypothetical protein
MLVQEIKVPADAIRGAIRGRGRNADGADLAANFASALAGEQRCGQ